MVRIAALLVVTGSLLAAAGPVAAQFNIFGDPPPPRPPQDIPNGPFPPQPPPASYPGSGLQQPYPGPGAGAPQPYPAALPRGSAPPPAGSAIQAEPLLPPPGVGVAPAPGPAPNLPQQRPGERAIVVPPPGATPPAANNNAPAPPEGAEPPPTEDTVVEKPTEHIDNSRAVFSGLDKITGRTFSFDAAIGETVRFGALEVTPRACYTRPPTEATNTDAFVEVDEVTLKGEIKRIFTGWMFAASPGLHAVEHPIYDVWLTNCAAPVQTSQAEPATAAPPPPPPAAAAPARSRRPAQAPPPHQRAIRPLPGALQPQPQ